MPWIDFEQIVADADPVLVARHIGMEVKMRSGRHMILCPSHPDRNMGSCYLTEKGYRCYSCGAKGNVIHMASVYLGVSLPDAAAIVAEVNGGASQYQTGAGTFKRNYESRKKLISPEEQRLIGLINKPVYHKTLVPQTEELQLKTEGVKLCWEEGIATMMECIDHNPLHTLYLQNQELYHEVIQNRCMEQIKKLNQLIEDIRGQKFAWLGSLLPEASELTEAVKALISQIEVIALRHGGKNVSVVTDLISNQNQNMMIGMLNQQALKQQSIPF